MLRREEIEPVTNIDKIDEEGKNWEEEESWKDSSERDSESLSIQNRREDIKQSKESK